MALVVRTVLMAGIGRQVPPDPGRGVADRCRRRRTRKTRAEGMMPWLLKVSSIRAITLAGDGVR
jgi:hypothetical protein